VWYAYDDPLKGPIVELPLDYVNEIIEKNKDGKIIDKLERFDTAIEIDKNDYENVVGQDSINRFDKKKKSRKPRKKRFNKRKTNAK
jgi:hypothetical protein